MSLNLTRTAAQIDRMALALRTRQTERQQRLHRALAAVESFDVNEYEGKRQRSKTLMAWPVPDILDDPGARYLPPSTPQDFCVAAVDGSHIDIDRHMPARCFLINIGECVLTYGSRPDARLTSRPRLYAEDNELVMRDERALYREEQFQGPVLGAKRMVEEMAALVKIVRELPPNLPTLALMDGSLIMLDLVGHRYPDYVLRELVEEGFVKALEELRDLARERPLALASYISLPRSTELVNGLRVGVCPYDVADCGANCAGVATGQRPCDAAAEGLLDREVIDLLLEPGERSAVFGSPSALVSNLYDEHGVNYFYVHAGEEIGRVEVPSWVADNEDMLGLAHSLVVDQCRRGPGYPIALMEAHEQAVVTGADRRSFAQLVENALFDQRMPVYSSEKSRSKRIRWL